MEEDKPIAFLCGPLSASNKFLSTYEKVFLALIMAVEKWRPYLRRQEFPIRIDHKSLYPNEQVLQSEVQRKAMTRLMGLQFKIVYRKGKKNVVVHALSKIPNLMQI
jgi:hypothetical protein